jgi:hypothetical protein
VDASLAVQTIVGSTAMYLVMFFVDDRLGSSTTI